MTDLFFMLLYKRDIMVSWFAGKAAEDWEREAFLKAWRRENGYESLY